MEKQKQRKLTIIKSIHTLIWFVLSSAVLYVLWSGVSGYVTRWSWICALILFAEALVLLLFEGSCPLTKIARRYSTAQQHNFDIYLPEFVARYNKQIFGALFLVGLLLMSIRVCFLYCNNE